jgi:transcription elongation factor SPT6
VNSVTGQQSFHFPEDPSETPEIVAQVFICDKFKDSEKVLSATRHIIAQDIAVQPELLAFIRRVYNKDAVVNVVPTEKGKLEIEQHHPYYVFFI